MKLRRNPEVAAWLEKADRDLRMARLAMSEEHKMSDQACFHSQQCAEKVLKALLVAADRIVPRTHNLIALLDEATESFPEMCEWADALANLTAYAVSPRYPSWLADETAEEAADAIAAATALVSRITLLLPDS